MNNNRIPTVGAEKRHLNQKLFYAIDADDIHPRLAQKNTLRPAPCFANGLSISG